MADKSPSSPLLQRKRSSTRHDKSWWDPTACSPVALVLLLLGAAAAWVLLGGTAAEHQQPACIRYAPRHCLFRLNTLKAIKRPPCRPKECAFDGALLDCPFAANGSFVRINKADPSQACDDPFLEGGSASSISKSAGPTPVKCGAACCAGDLPGSFSPDKQSKLPGALQWQPQPASNRSCSYHQFTALEVLHHLQRTRTRLLVVGDSMQKQLHGRIVHMFRGSRHPIDNRVFTMARYALCSAGDSYVIAPTYTKQIKGVRPEPTLEALPSFFGTTVDIPGCSKQDPPAIIDSLYSAWFKHQTKHLEAYIDLLQPAESLVLVIGVSFIDKSTEPRPEWLDYMAKLKERVTIIIVPTPTGLTHNKQQVERLRGRNTVLRKWAAFNGVGYVDFDAMSRDAGHPPHCVSNIHWMCWLEWAGGKPQEGKPTPAAGDNVLRDARFGTPVASVYTTEDGQCRDEMNRNLAQLIFNMFINRQ